MVDPAGLITPAEPGMPPAPLTGPRRHSGVTDDRRPRLVASDLDGTLLRSDGRVSAYTARIWRALPAAGVETVLVTARPPRWLHALAHVVGPRGVALCGNGAFVYDVGRRTVLAAHCFDRDVLLGVVADLRETLPGVVLAAERAHGAFFEPGWPDPHAPWETTTPEWGSGSAIAEQPVGKLLALWPGHPVQDFLDVVETVVGDRGHLAYSGAHGLAEINPRGVGKATALADWCRELGIGSADVWAFGDMPNDLPMLRWAGRAYAVANAHAEVHSVATHTCPANDDDGVARALEPLLIR